SEDELQRLLSRFGGDEAALGRIEHCFQREEVARSIVDQQDAYGCDGCACRHDALRAGTTSLAKPLWRPLAGTRTERSMLRRRPTLRSLSGAAPRSGLRISRACIPSCLVWLALPRHKAHRCEEVTIAPPGTIAPRRALRLPATRGQTRIWFLPSFI